MFEIKGENITASLWSKAVRMVIAAVFCVVMGCVVMAVQGTQQAFAQDAESAVNTELSTQAAKVVGNNKTVVDWFASRGSNEAVNLIKNSKYSSYTNIGSPTDATDLNNVKKSLETILDFNKKYRKALGLGELKVSDSMMATAIADANYSDKNVAHAQQFEVSENLSWGYADPYQGWYYEEKALYDKGVRDFSQIGHYLNVIEPGYLVTGFGINTTGSNFGTCMSQTYTADDFGYAEGAVPASQYYSEFMDYYNKNARVAVYRLYNPYSTEHLFTLDYSEYSILCSLGWKGEGVAWNAPAAGTPVYRLYNKWSGDHHYTTDKSEYNKCVKRGWKGENVAFYSGGDKPVYRLFNQYVQSFYHHYTMGASEYKKCIKNGWTDEKIGWYGYAA